MERRPLQNIFGLPGGQLQFLNSAYNSIIITFADSGNVLLGSATDDGLNRIQAWGNIAVKAIGSGVRVAEGTNAKQGAVTLSAGSAVVSNTNVTVNSRIFLTGQSDGGTPGFVRVSSRVAGTSFTITSSSSTDTSTIAYEIIEPS